MVLPVTEMMSSLGLAEIKWSCRRTSWERHLFLILPGSVSLAHRRKNDIESSIRGKEQYFQGRLVPIITATIIRSRKATVSRARCAGAPSCRKTKSHPGISRICMAVASGQEGCSLCPIHFDTLLDKWISVLPSFETPTCVLYKFSTFVR